MLRRFTILTPVRVRSAPSSSPRSSRRGAGRGEGRQHLPDPARDAAGRHRQRRADRQRRQPAVRPARPLGEHPAGQRAADRIRQGRRPPGRPHRLRDPGEHRHAHRRHRAVRHPAEPAARAVPPGDADGPAVPGRVLLPGPQEPLPVQRPLAVRRRALQRCFNSYYRNFKNPGLQATIDGVEQTTGLDVNETLSRPRSFAFVNAIGGVDVNVRSLPRRGPRGRVRPAGGREGLHRARPPAPQRLLALWFARSRSDSSDFDRMARQRCVIGASPSR